MFGVGLTLPKISAVLLNAIGGLLAAYKINDLTPDLVADFNGSLNDGTEFYNAGGTVDTFAELITHSRAGNATMTDGYGPELVTNGTFNNSDGWSTGAGWEISNGQATRITGTYSELLYTFPSALQAGKTYTIEFTAPISGNMAVGFIGPNVTSAYATRSGATAITLTATGSHTGLRFLPAGSVTDGAIDNVSVREVPAIKWAPHNMVTYSEDLTATSWVTTGTGTVADSFTVSLSGTDSLTSDFTTTQVGASYTVEVELWTETHIGEQVDFGFSTNNLSNTFSAPITLTATPTTYSFSKSNNTATQNGFRLRNYGGTTKTVKVSKVRLYRSDLGGMVDNPETGDSYVPTTSSAVYLPRRNHHVYNGSAWVNEGVLHESEARTNLFTSSNSLATATNITATLNNIVSPDGKINGTLLSNQGGNWHYYHSPISLIQNTQYTLSCYAKYKAGSGFVWLLCEVSSDAFVMFDILDGVAVNLGTGSQQADSSSIEDAGNGWFRISATFTKTSAGALDSIGIGVSPTSTQPNWDATGLEDTEQAYVYGFQTEAGSTPSSLMPTNGSTVSRALETLTIPAVNMPWPEPNYIGPELVVNGDFSTDSNWVKGTGWSITGGAAYYSSGGGGGDIRQNVPMVNGKTYLISLDVVSLSGSAIASIRLNAVVLGSNITQSGTYEYVYTKTASEAGDVIVKPNNLTECTIDNVSVREIDPLSVSIQMQGRMTYADTGSGAEVSFSNWANGQNYILSRLNTASTFTGRPQFLQKDGVTEDLVQGSATAYSPSVLVPFNIASRHGSTFINGAVDGVALTANTTPVALPDLSATDFNLGYDYMGTISMLRVWADDLADVGIAEATEPSEVPSLQLTFDNSETSFTVQDWEQ